MVIYSGLKETKEKEGGWDKKTIEYILNNEREVKNAINRMGFNIKHSNLNVGTVDDIYSRVLEYFYSSSDYEKDKAHVGEHEVTISEYVYKCIKCVVLNYMSKEMNESSYIVNSYYRNSDGEEQNLMEMIRDEKSEESYDNIYNLEETLKYWRFKQYKYGIDMYKILLIGLITTALGKEDLYDKVLEILNIDTENIVKFESRALGDEMVKDITKCVVNIDIWKAIDTISKYVYCGREIVDIVSNT